MKLLILGRTASGKDTVANNLEKNFGLKRVVSYTDRPKREGEPENSHTFVTSEEIENLKPDMVAMTEINGYTYGATKQQVEEADMYVIDPKGYEEIVKAMPNTAFVLIYVNADDDARKKHYLAREANNPNALNTWNARNSSEDMQFLDFELTMSQIGAMMEEKQPSNIEFPLPTNVVRYTSMQNDYSEEFQDPNVVAHFALDVNASHNIKHMLYRLIQKGDLELSSVLGLPINVSKPDDLDLFASNIKDIPSELFNILLGWIHTEKHF